MKGHIAVAIILVVMSCSCGRPRTSPPSPPNVNHLEDGLESPAAARQSPSFLADDKSLQYIRAYLGRYPQSIKLFDTEPLQSHLTELLGAHYDQFIHCMRISSPLKKSEAGIYYLTGRQRSSDGQGKAYLLIDPVLEQLEAGLILQGSLKRFRGPGNEIPFPTEVRLLIENATFQPE